MNIMNYNTRDVNPGKFWKINMRHLFFLFLFVLAAVFGCSKKSPVPAPPPPDASNQETNHEGESGKADAAVDIFIHNSTSNDYVIELREAGRDFAGAAPGPGKTNVTPERWRYWPDVYVFLTQIGPQTTSSVVVPLAEVNQKIPPGEFSQVRFDVLDSDNVDVSCDKTGTLNSQEQALIPIPPDTSSQAASQKSSPDLKQALVHIIVHYASTNDYWVQFDKTGPDMPPVLVWSGHTGISSVVPWNYLPGAKVVLTDEHTGQKYFVDVSFAAANEKLSSGKYHKIGLWVDSASQVKMDCEE